VSHNHRFSFARRRIPQHFDERVGGQKVVRDTVEQGHLRRWRNPDCRQFVDVVLHGFRITSGPARNDQMLDLKVEGAIFGIEMHLVVLERG
jgi:hypothetical protein